MPSIPVSRAYEAVYILDPDTAEEQVSATTARYRQIVEARGGEVTKVDVWERRRLAYEVRGRNEGIYVIMTFNGFPDVEAELRRIFQISEDQIRFMIVKPEDITEPTERAGRFGRNEEPELAPAQPQAQPAPVAAAEPVQQTEAAPEAAAPTAEPIESVTEPTAEAAPEPVAAE